VIDSRCYALPVASPCRFCTGSFSTSVTLTASGAIGQYTYLNGIWVLRYTAPCRWTTPTFAFPLGPFYYPSAWSLTLDSAIAQTVQIGRYEGVDTDFFYQRVGVAWDCVSPFTAFWHTNEPMLPEPWKGEPLQVVISVP
jgi:hypothetical protein